MTLQEKISKLTQRLPSILDGATQDLHDSLNAFIQAEVDQKKRNPASISASARITEQRPETGGLIDSFQQGKPGSLTSIKREGLAIKGTFGTNVVYANIHEYGGFIKSKTKYSMFGGLMKKYKATGLDFYKGVALKTLKNFKERGTSGIEIKARPYFNPAIKKFNSTGLSLWRDRLVEQINEAWNE